MARAFPASQPTDYGTPSQPGDWQALRGELEALLDQVEGQYAPSGGTSDAAFAGFAQRMQDLRYQVADTNPDDRRREALRSVKRQIERFNERDEPEPVPHADNVLQSAIQQIRARTGGVAPSRSVDAGAPKPVATPAPRFDELSQSMAGLSGRLAQFETELKTQRGNAAQVKEIAEQVSQLSHVMELLAGAVGETGQVKRLESQIAGLAQLMTQAQKPDLTQMTERLDALSATVDRLADLQVQQIQHVVREAEAGPQNNAEAAAIMHSIEESVRSIYDRLDRIESNASAPRADLEQVTAALAQISARLGSESGRPERLLSLVNALNSRINEVEDRGEGLDGLKADIEALRGAIVGAIEPRFANIESRLGDLGEKLQGRDSSDSTGMAQIEAQIRQLVARMDQTGEQLSGLAQLYSSGSSETPDFETLAHLAATRASETTARNAPAAPDFNSLAELVASRTADAVTQLPKAPTPDFDALAELVASRAAEAVARLPQAPAPDLSALADQAAAKASAAMRAEPANGRAATEAGLAEFEARVTRLIDGLVRARPPEAIEGVTTGIGRVEERLAALETALTRRIDAGFASARATAAPTVRAQQTAPAPDAALPQPAAAAPFVSTASAAEGAKLPTISTVAIPPEDVMPRNPAAEAPLKEFGFPDLGPVRAALEAKNGPRKVHPGAGKPVTADPHFDMEPITPEMAGGISHPKPSVSAETRPPDFDPAQIVRPPRPQSSLDMVLPAIPVAPAAKAPTAEVPEVSASTRNTFIEAARRAAQRQNQAKPQADANSLMGRAFARFQQGEPIGDKPGKADAQAKAAAIPAGRMVTPEPPPPELPAKVSRKDKKQLAREAAKVAALDLPTDVAAGSAEQREAPRASFLVRHRRPILLGASLAAVLFMALNLVMQRLATHQDQAAPAVVTTEQTPAVAPAAVVSEPAPLSVPAPAAGAKPNDSSSPLPPKPADGNNGSTPSPKPISEAVPLANPVTVSPVAAAPGPRIIAADPTTTASITPDAALNFAPSSADAAMPPALAAANATAGAAPATIASIAPADATAPTAAASTPVAMESPVKVDMPPAGLGPEDLRQAAANGDAHAQFEIAAIYSEGRAVPQDFAQAEIWYERAAAQGFGPAQYRLGNLYENGKGVTKDLEQARLWYQRSSEAGNRMAMHNLAALYAGGQLGKQDFASAAEWFERAANLGMKDSQFNLGMLYARGLGVTQNLETSYQWFALAAGTGDADAAKARDNIGRSLDAAAIKRVTAAVAAWKPTQIDLSANYAPIGTWDKSFNPGPTITDKAVITKVQGALIRLGYDIGAPNGHAGTKTADAIKAFERSTGMSEVGAINPRLLAVLGSQPV
ncbi:MAG: peptidoglycan-binding protein [Devosia sp.]